MAATWIWNDIFYFISFCEGKSLVVCLIERLDKGLGMGGGSFCLILEDIEHGGNLLSRPNAASTFDHRILCDMSHYVPDSGKHAFDRSRSMDKCKYL